MSTDTRKRKAENGDDQPRDKMFKSITRNPKFHPEPQDLFEDECALNSEEDAQRVIEGLGRSLRKHDKDGINRYLNDFMASTFIQVRAMEAYQSSMKNERLLRGRYNKQFEELINKRFYMRLSLKHSAVKERPHRNNPKTSKENKSERTRNPKFHPEPQDLFEDECALNSEEDAQRVIEGLGRSLRKHDKDGIKRYLNDFMASTFIQVRAMEAYQSSMKNERRLRGRYNKQFEELSNKRYYMRLSLKHSAVKERPHRNNPKTSKENKSERYKTFKSEKLNVLKRTASSEL
ncbi:hypothetical protein ACOME3_006275 [Neoechinorhynchus agilis]